MSPVNRKRCSPLSRRNAVAAGVCPGGEDHLDIAVQRVAPGERAATRRVRAAARAVGLVHEERHAGLSAPSPASCQWFRYARSIPPSRRPPRPHPRAARRTSARCPRRAEQESADVQRRREGQGLGRERVQARHELFDPTAPRPGSVRGPDAAILRSLVVMNGSLRWRSLSLQSQVSLKSCQPGGQAGRIRCAPRRWRDDLRIRAGVVAAEAGGDDARRSPSA